MASNHTTPPRDPERVTTGVFRLVRDDVEVHEKKIHKLEKWPYLNAALVLSTIAVFLTAYGKLEARADEKSGGVEKKLDQHIVTEEKQRKEDLANIEKYFKALYDHQRTRKKQPTLERLDAGDD